MRRPDAILFFLAALIAAAVFLNGLPGAFQYDDFHHIVDNPSLRSLHNFSKWFTDPTSFSVTKAPMYRPLTMLSLALNYRLDGYNPRGYLAVNIFLHAACAGLVFLLLRSLNFPRASAFIGAVFFAVHPVQTETVNYINCRSTLLCAVFFLLSLLCLLQWTRRKRWSLLIIASLLFLLSLLAKPLSITLPAVVVLFILFMSPAWKKGKDSVRLLWMGAAGLVLTAILYLLWNRILGQWTFSSPYAPRGTGENILTEIRVIAYYLWLIVFPRVLSVDHPVPIAGSFFEPVVLGSFLAIVFIGAAALYFRKSRPCPGLGFFWFLITLLPTSSIIPLNHLIAENREYLPLAGVAIVFAEASSYLLRLKNPGHKKASVALLTAVLMMFAAFTILRNPVWHSEQSLWLDAFQKAPDSETAQTNLGQAFNAAGRPDRARTCFKLILRKDPMHFEARYNLAVMALDEGRYGDALAVLEVLAGEARENPGLHFNLGRGYIGERSYRMAEQQLRQALHLKPDYAQACIELAHLYARLLRMPAQAEDTIKKCRGMNLDNDQIRMIQQVEAEMKSTRQGE